MVDGEAELPTEEADAAGGRQSADAHSPGVAELIAQPRGARAAATSPHCAPGPIRTRRVASSSTSMPRNARRSITIPPSFVERPLIPWPAERIESGT